MLPYIMGVSTIVGSVRPYVRKHILDVLDPSDYFFINSILITVFVILYFGYLAAFDNYGITKIYSKCCSLTPTQVGAMIALAAFTVISSISLFMLEKHFNTPAMNHMMLKAVSLIMLFVVGIFIFNEDYSLIHMLGIALTIVGVFILFMNPMKKNSK